MSLESHPSSCSNAKTHSCNCRCNGDKHGRTSGILTKEQQAKIQNLAVGDIVVCHGWNKTEGKLGFIEEIIVNSGGKFKATGQFSVYGLEFATFQDSRPSRYFGDNLGYQLEPNGDKMTKERLEKYAKVEPNNKGIQKDIEIVIKNLGRTSGRNVPPRTEIFS